MNWVCVKEAERVDLEEYNRRVHFLSHDERKKIVKLLKRVNTKQMMWLITFIRKSFLSYGSARAALSPSFCR